MKKIILLFAVTVSAAAFSQTVLYTNDFEGAPGFSLNTTDLGGTTSGDNPWVINNVYAGGSGQFFCAFFGSNVPFTVPAAAQQPAGITNNPTSQHLHVTPQIAIDDGGPSLPAASYVAADGFCIFGGGSTFSGMTNDINTIGNDSITLDLWWMCGGSPMYYGELYYSLDGGTSWSSVNCPTTGTTQWRNETSWVNDIVSDPSWANQATLRFGFRFVTGTTSSGSELDPGFAIDDIVVTGYTACSPTSSSISETACYSYTSPAGNTYTSTGTYTDTIANTAGCDSIITIGLTINTADTSVVSSSFTLSAQATGATYQWLDCNSSYAVIPGETGQNFSPTVNGNYAVEVNQNGCVDTSSCYAVTGLGLGEDVFGSAIKLYPNPTEGDVFVEIGAELTEVSVIVKNVEGKVINRLDDIETSTLTLHLDGERGVYLIEVVSGELRQLYRIVKM